MRQLLVSDYGALPEALAAPVGDPLWAVYQQLAMGELRGESAGTMVRAEVTTESVPLPRGHDLPRVVTEESTAQLDVITRTTVLAEVGLRVLAWVRDNRGVAALPPLRTAHPLFAPDRDDALHASLLARASIDPIHLRDDLAATGLDAALLAVVEDELAASLPGENGLWRDEALHVGGPVDDGSGVVLQVRELEDGPLGWWHLELDTIPTAAATSTTQITLPLPLSFAGAPSRRYWAMEDRQVHMGGVVSQSDALEPLIAAEFVMLYGDDWHVVPVTAQRGSLVRVASVVVTDTFGEVRDLPSATRRDIEAGRPPWALWHPDGERALGDPGWLTATEGPWLALLPAQPGHDGPVLERVALYPDEAANLAWAREDLTPRWNPGETDRPDTIPTIPVDQQQEMWTWTLASRVPSDQFPLLPESRSVGTGEAPQIDLVLGSLAGATSTPSGQLLTGLAGARVPEESVRAPGVVVERRWRRTRLPDGSVQVWTRRGARIRAPGSSATVVFDAVKRAEVADE